MKKLKIKNIAPKLVQAFSAMALLLAPLLMMGQAHAAVTAQLYLGPSSQSVSTGSTVTVTLNMTSGSNAVFAWQAYIKNNAVELLVPQDFFSQESLIHRSNNGRFGLQSLADILIQCPIVFYQENFHYANVKDWH